MFSQSDVQISAGLNADVVFAVVTGVTLVFVAFG